MSGTRTLLTLVALTAAFALTGCSTAPDQKNRATFLAESDTAMEWFESNVSGLSAQLDRSGGYVIFPGVGQWGFLFTGGKAGRGLVAGPDRDQQGWAALATGSLGLQVGVQGFKMLVVFENEGVLDDFKQGKLNGSVAAVGVAGKAGGSVAAKFVNGVAVYQGDNTGLMAGANVGLDWMRYEPLDQ